MCSFASFLLHFPQKFLYVPTEAIRGRATKYSQTPEIETADLSQSYAGLNLYKFQTYC